MIAQNKSKDWTLKDIDEILKSLKNNKARDPMGMVSDIFKPEIAGWDLRNSIMGLLNGLKNEQKSVPLTNVANITTIFKKKGSQLDMENDRGIFILPVFRMILEKTNL